MTAKNILKKWFENFKKPTQEQFWEWLDSYWHKSEKIPIQKVEGFIEMLDNKVDKEAGKELSANDFTDELKEKLENLKSSANVREINETFTVTENDLSSSEIELILSNNIAPFSHVIVETEDFILKAESINYLVNTNIVTVLKQKLYFDFELNENITVYYSYLSDQSNEISLSNLNYKIQGDENVEISANIINSSNKDKEISLKTKLDGFSEEEETVLIVPANSSLPFSKIYTSVPEGTYSFKLTGDLTEQLNNIVVVENKAILSYDSFTVQNSDNTYTANVIVSNSGNKTGETSVYFQLDNGNKVKIGNFAIPPNTSKTFTKTFNVADSGNHVINAFEADGVTQIGSTYEFSVENRPAEISWKKGFYVNFNKNTGLYKICKEFNFVNSSGIFLGWFNYSIDRLYFEYDTSKVTSCVGAEIDYWGRIENLSCSEREIVESTTPNYSAQALFDSHNNTNLIESITQNNSGGHYTHFHAKLTNLAVNLINSSSKFSILMRVKDDVLNAKIDSIGEFKDYIKRDISPKLKLTY